MRRYAAGILSTALFATGAFGQTVVDRKYTFAHIETTQELQEIANAMRTMAEMRQASADNALKTIAVSGTASQVGVTDWIFKELDQPPQGQAADDRQYTVAKDDILRVFYLPSTKTVQEFQEISNGVRTVLEIRRAIAENQQRALILRGTAAQIAQSAWLVDELTQANPTSGVHQYQGPVDDVTQVFYLPSTYSVNEFQEIANGVRTLAEIRRAVGESASRALVLRDTRDKLAIASWVLNDLVQPHTAGSVHQYQVAADDLVRVFYLPSTSTVKDFLDTAIRVRTAAQIRRAVTENSMRAFMVRGTPLQITQAEQMIQAGN
jgi:hypothetical protein